MVGQAAAVGKQIAHGQHRAAARIAQRKPGQQVLHAAVPGDPSQADLARHHGGSQGFGDRGQLEHGVGIHGRTAAGLAKPQALGGKRLRALDHGPGHARNTADAAQRCGQLGQPPGRLRGAQAFCWCIVSAAARQSQPGAGRDAQAGSGADGAIEHLASGPCSLGWLAHDFSSRLVGLRLQRGKVLANCFLLRSMDSCRPFWQFEI